MELNKRQVGIIVLWGILIIGLMPPTSLIEFLHALIKACGIIFLGLAAIHLLEKNSNPK